MTHAHARNGHGLARTGSTSSAIMAGKMKDLQDARDLAGKIFKLREIFGGRLFGGKSIFGGTYLQVASDDLAGKVFIQDAKRYGGRHNVLQCLTKVPTR